MDSALEEFVKWLAILFRKDDKFARARAWIYYEYVTSGKLVNKRGLSKSSFSRIKSKLISEGFFYKTIVTEKKEEMLIPLHPTIALDLAAYKHLTSKDLLTERYGNIINQMEKGWNKFFGSIFLEDKSCIFPVEGWHGEYTYGNTLSWILILKEQVKRVSLFTPNLRLLRNPVYKKILREIQKEYGTMYYFYCFEESRKKIKNDDLKVTFYIIDPNRTDSTPYFDRVGIFYNIQNEAIFGFKYIKIDDLDKYVGFIICRDKRLKHLVQSLKNLEEASRVNSV